MRFHGLTAPRLHEAMEVGASRDGLVLEDRDVVTWEHRLVVPGYIAIIYGMTLGM